MEIHAKNNKLLVRQPKQEELITASGIILPKDREVNAQDIKEWCCTVVSVGPDAGDYKEGDVIVVDPSMPPAIFEHNNTLHFFINSNQILAIVRN